MSPERWQQMWAIFEAVLERPPGERQAFLDQACGDDAAVRKTVEGLLRADAEADVFLDQPIVESGLDLGDATAVAPPAVRREPGRIGPYRLLHPVGEGGMGTAYLAVRDDDSFQRRVVVKLVRRGMENDEVLRRMRTERQILAGLDHPSIARLYDGGTTDDHLPYFVMEYVEGVAIDEYCEINRLSVDARLELFTKVCAAVHYAHQNLVVHRDLKPSNILVTAAGEPKLLDFGIAKLLNPELSSREVEPTAAWHRMLTPNYASPEQIRGKLVTTVSDVYSLGVLLYKLLTGRLPYRFKNRSPQEIERVLTESEPPRPSTVIHTRPSEGLASEELASEGEDLAQLCRNRRATPRELERQLRGDLDSIVLMALRSTPQQRYGSVEQFAADVERFREGRAVLARKGTWRYRMAKLVRRHRTAVAAGAVALALLTAFAVAMAWQSARVARERDQARLERDKKQQVLRLMLDVFSVNDPRLGPGERAAVTVSDALSRSGPLLERRLRQDPAVRAEILQATGILYTRLGLPDRALEDLEEALTLRRALYGAEHADVAKTSSGLGIAYQMRGELDRAEQLSRQAVEILRRPAVAGPADLLEGLNDLVSILCERSAYEQAEPLAREAVEIGRRLPDRQPELAFALNSLAAVRSAEGQYREAAALYRQSIALLEALWGPEHPTLAYSLNNLAVALRQLGEFGPAEEIYGRILAIQRQALGEEHFDLAATFNNLGGVQFAGGQYREAAASYERALAVLRGAVGPDHPNVLLVELRLEACRVHFGQAPAAEQHLRGLLERWGTRLADGDWRLALGQGILGEALAAQGRDGEAEPLLVGSYRQLLEQSRYRRKKEALDRLTAFYEARGRGEDAARHAALLPPPEEGEE